MKSRIMNKAWALLLGLLMLAACSEDDNTVEEFPNWQATNEQAFADTLAYARARINAGDTDTWKVFLNWALENQTAPEGTFLPEYGDDSHIAVRVIQQGTGSGCPMYTDSVKVHYRGRLLPSASYEDGYVFDQSYTGEFDETTALPRKFPLSGLVDGFATALMRMHIGDRWMVYIPANLAYGESESTSVPAYSMLRFDMQLVAYYRAGTPTGGSRASEGYWVYE